MKKHVILLGLIGLIIMMSFPVDVVAQTFDWSDNFNDENYDGWTVIDGAYTATGGELFVTAVGAGDAHPFIYHPSNTSFGNWSFDVTIVDDPQPDPDHVMVSFMSDHRSVIGGPADSSFMLQWEGSWKLWRELTQIDLFPADKYWEHHLRVERKRAEPNTFYVYHNGTLALEADYVIVPDNDWGYFGFSASVGSSIDNINVEYEPDIIPSTSTTTTTEPTTTEEPTTTPEPTEPPDMTMVLLIAGGGVVVVVVIALVVRMRS
jgi:hypothetical protein